MISLVKFGQLTVIITEWYCINCSAQRKSGTWRSRIYCSHTRAIHDVCWRGGSKPIKSGVLEVVANLSRVVSRPEILCQVVFGNVKGAFSGLIISSCVIEFIELGFDSAP